jgi:hypothetical protein
MIFFLFDNAFDKYSNISIHHFKTRLARNLAGLRIESDQIFLKNKGSSNPAK